MDQEDDVIQDGLDIIELERSAGWAKAKAKLTQQIEELESQSKIDVDGKTAEQVGMEYVRIQERLSGLRRILEIIIEFKEAYENAHNKN